MASAAVLRWSLILGRHFFFASEGGYIGRSQILGQVQFPF